MTRAEARARLDRLNATIASAVMMIRCEKPTLEQFFEEQRRMQSAGPILDPTLFNASERAAVEALLAPVYEAAAKLVDVFDMQTARAAAALEKVKADG